VKAETKYLNSKETEKKLKISSCELMHIRVQGKLKYIKKGNAFLYNTNDIEKLDKK